MVQTNLTCNIPGQLQSRGGMRRVSTVAQQPTPLLDCYPCSYGGSTYLVALTATGTLVAMQSPAIAPAPDLPSRPSVSLSAGVCQTNYAYDYASGGVINAPPVVPPPGPTLLTVLDGGAAVAAFSYAVDANSLCSGTGKADAFDGGLAVDPVVEVGVQTSAMCAA